MNYFDALSTLIDKKDREEIRNELLKEDMDYKDITIYNVVKGDTRYSPKILKAIHKKAIAKLAEIEEILNKINPNDL